MFKKIFISMVILILPIDIVFAYSKEVIVGGQNIGIEVNTDGVLVIGLYEVNGELIAKSSNISTGDYLIKVNGNNINSISDFSREIYNDDDKEYLDITYRRDNKEYNTNLRLMVEDNEYRTGLYVKDTINGIGTLTLIDPLNNRFLALGHQIQESNTNKILEINNGKIYNSYITDIRKSKDGVPGEKVANSHLDDIIGTINTNTKKGIFGTYNSDLNKNNLVEIGTLDEVKLGKASMLTVIENDIVEEFDINIDKIDKKDELKNILFTITDKRLLEKTGGIVQGMSGSPIMQGGKLVGAVTHVIVDDCEKGYGISIINMLEESEKGL